MLLLVQFLTMHAKFGATQSQKKLKEYIQNFAKDC